MSQEHQYDADVVIIGYGPTAVTAASRLAALGVKTIAFERDKDLYARARAVTVNDWTCRIFQAMGIDADVKKTMDVMFEACWKTYDGIELNRMKFPPSNFGHFGGYSIYQPAMEQVMRDGAARFSSHLDVHFGAEVIAFEQDEDGVLVIAKDVDTGDTKTVRAKYALGCHGGNAITREMFGVELAGDTVDVRWVVIDARVKRWWPDRNVLTFWSDKKRPVVDITLGLGNHRWEFPLEPHESDSDFETPDQLWPLLESLGASKDDVEIHQHAFYNHHIRAAEKWRIGRLFLLGDAAHLMPPWAGAGMQSGIRDAFSLAWRIAEVVKGAMPDSVLDTYQEERAPDVQKWTDTAVSLGRIIKQELTDEELVALMEDAADPTKIHPMFQPPVLTGGWVNGPVDDTSVVGKMIPQPLVSSANGKYDLLDEILGDGMVLMGDDVNPETLLTPEQKADWDGLGTSYRRVHATSERSGRDTDIVDLDGSLLEWMRSYGAKVVAVRPDRFVAAADVSGLSMPS